MGMLALLLLWLSRGAGGLGAAAEAVDLLHLPPAPQPAARGESPAAEGREAYARWRERWGWEDRRPFSDSASRFRIESGALRLESARESFLIGRVLPPAERRAIADFPYLRFAVRIAAVPRGARLAGEARDDAAFRIYVTFRDDPPQALVYVWSWALPVGAWSARGRSLWGDFRAVHRKAFGQGEPRPDQWLLVEVDLRRDFAARFPAQPLPMLAGLALKADSNDTPDGRSLAWLRSVTLHATSLRAEGIAEGDRIDDAEVWFR